jgi:hypothetical protein
MIAPLRTSSLDCSSESAYSKFLSLLPRIRQQAVFAFRNLRAEAREELTEEVIANAFRAFAQLVHQGKVALAYPTPLAQFAIRQVRARRRVGGRLNVNDVLSGHALRRRGFQVERLDHVDLAGEWHEALVLDHRTPVDEQAAFRIDFPAWLARLAPRQRRIVKFLAAGNSTSDAARRFRISPARISQLRAWFRAHWERFQGQSRSVDCAA